MSEISLAAESESDSETEARERFLRTWHEYNQTRWGQLLTNPAGLLRALPLTVNKLPARGDGALENLWFAATNDRMVIDEDQGRAWQGAGGRDHPNAAIQRRFIVSPMRESGRAPGTGATQRYEPTETIDAGSVASDVWVTEMQNGCTVLILDWGQGKYSLVHLQPSEDTQFNWLGQSIIGLGGYTRWITGERLFMNLYKNAWLKQEMGNVAASTGGTPQNYIMVQSMFEASRGKQTQVIGIRKGKSFTFYRQRVYGRTIEVDELKWSGWWSYLPALTSRTY
jgi:hypothetical protein